MCLNEGKITSIFGYFCVSTCPDKEKMKVSMKRHDNFNQDYSSKGSVPAAVISSYSANKSKRENGEILGGMNFQFSRGSLFPQKTLMGSRIQKKPSESQPTAQSTDTHRWQKTVVVYKLLGFIGCNFPFLPLSLSAQYQSVLTLAKIYSSVPKEG